MTGEGDAARQPALGGIGTEWDLVWAESPGTDERLVAAWLAPLGNTLDGTTAVVSDPLALVASPAVVATGAGIAIAWVDESVGNGEIEFALVGCGPVP